MGGELYLKHTIIIIKQTNFISFRSYRCDRFIGILGKLTMDRSEVVQGLCGFKAVIHYWMTKEGF